jgi:hypothetical protein
VCRAGEDPEHDPPDPDLKWNSETNHYDFGAIDWDEFWNVVNGNGPCNKERLAARVKAHSDGGNGYGKPRRYMRKRERKRIERRLHKKKYSMLNIQYSILNWRRKELEN